MKNKTLCSDYWFGKECRKENCSDVHPEMGDKKGICSRFQRIEPEATCKDPNCGRLHLALGEEQARMLKTEIASRASTPRSSRANSPARSAADSPGGPQVCKFFLQGKCNRGKSCRWAHPNAEA